MDRIENMERGNLGCQLHCTEQSDSKADLRVKLDLEMQTLELLDSSDRFPCAS